MSAWESDNIFCGTACYYSRFRPDYPPETIDLIVDRFSLSKKSRVLDLGCGTGQVALKIAPFVSGVIAIDPQEEMLREGKSLASERGITNINWNRGESADLSRMSSVIGEVDLTVIARAFHWMDRAQTLRDLYAITKPGGGLAIMSDNGPRYDPSNKLKSSSKWKSAIDDAVRCWLGDIRKAGTKGTFTHPYKKFETYVEESRFRDLETVRIETKRKWTIDGIIGYLYSTSSSSIPVLEDKKEPFEADIRRRLAEIDPSGVFEEDVTTEILMARKPINAMYH
jgi:ubiquinone/menaquinone biosynthesis C-methylase UbiE